MYAPWSSVRSYKARIKPSKPQACRHGGVKPVTGGWTKSYAKLDDWFWDYIMSHNLGGGAYGIYECTGCGLMCISSTRYK